MNSTSSAPPGLSPHRLRTGKLGRHLALLGLALLPALIFLVAESWLFDGDLQLPLDDSWIHLVFARSLSHGNGLAFNPGELVAGTTAPLWTALLGLLALLPGSPILWAKLAGIAAQAGSVFAVHRVALRLDFSPARALVAALLVAVSDWLVWSSLSGMEVNLFVLLFLAGLARHLRERAEPALPPVSFVLFGLAALARPEGLLLPFLALADRLFSLRAPQVPRAVTESGLRGSRPSRTAIASALSGILVALLVVVPVALAFHSMSGSFLPTTVAAKSSGPPMLVPDGRLLATVLGILFASQPWMTLLALGGVVESVRRFGGARDRGLLLALWTLALPLASAMLSSGKDVAVGNFWRYFFPLIPCVVLLGLLALAPLSFAGLRSATFCGVRLPVGALALVLLFAPTLVSLTKSLGRYLTSCANVRDSNVALAKWLGPRLPPDAVLAVNDVGAFKYLLPNRVLDLVGLMTPEVTHLRQQGARDGKVFSEVLAEFLDARKPDFVIVFPSWFAFPAQHPDRFHLLRMVSIRDNITMGGEMIALYDTPWTRRPLVALRGDEEPAETTAQPLPTESR